MRAALGVVVIAGVILLAMLTLALAGVIGAMVARLVAPGDDRGDSSWRWVGVAAASGIVVGQLAAFVAFTGSAAFGWSLEGFVLPPICWLVAAISGAVMCLGSRSSGDRPRAG